jgi:hypothetical protein
MTDIILLIMLWLGGLWFVGECIHTMSRDRGDKR